MLRDKSQDYGLTPPILAHPLRCHQSTGSVQLPAICGILYPTITGPVQWYSLLCTTPYSPCEATEPHIQILLTGKLLWGLLL